MSFQEMYPGPFSIPQTGPIPQLNAIAAQLAGLQSAYASSQARPIQPQGDHITRVKGFESVQQLPTSPNSRDVAFHETEDIFYVITTDASNFKTIRQFSFTEIVPEEAKPVQYVTVDEFNKFKEDVLNGQQFVRNAREAGGKQSNGWNNGSSGTGKTNYEYVKSNEKSPEGN